MTPVAFIAFPLSNATGAQVAIDERHQDKLTFPPFTRNRLFSER